MKVVFLTYFNSIRAASNLKYCLSKEAFSNQKPLQYAMSTIKLFCWPSLHQDVACGQKTVLLFVLQNPGSILSETFRFHLEMIVISRMSTKMPCIPFPVGQIICLRLFASKSHGKILNIFTKDLGALYYIVV